MLLTTPEQVERVAAAVIEAGAFAVDLEFVPESRYVPELALVQLAWGPHCAPRTAVIDPLEVDPGPVLRLVGDEGVETIAHAAQADLGLLIASFGVSVRRLHDTQIGAAFVGMGDQASYGTLVERVLGVELRKGSQFTDWLRRPLSSEQLQYALDDVRYLPALWHTLRRRLLARGRLRWVTEESEFLARRADRRPEPREAYLRVKGSSRMRRRSVGALRAIAEWRELEARRTNRPPARVLADRSMIELARAIPEDEAGLLSVRGVSSSLVRHHGAAMLRSLQEGAADPPPPEPRVTRSDLRVEVSAAALQSLVRARAQTADIASRFVATREDIEHIARWWLLGNLDQEPDVPLLQGWRRELVGRDALSWLAGESSIVADPNDPAGLRLEPRGEAAPRNA